MSKNNKVIEKIASILDIVADYIEKEETRKLAEEKEALNLLTSKGSISKRAAEKIAKDPELRKIYFEVFNNSIPKIAENVEDSPHMSEMDEAEIRFEKWLWG